MTEFWYDPLATSRLLAKIRCSGLPHVPREIALDGLELLQVLSVGQRIEWCKVQAHRSRLETRAKEYSMCASLRVSQNPKAK